VDDPLRLRAGGLSTYYELDLAGNVRRLRDTTGKDLGGYRYAAFGQAFPADAETPVASVTQSLQWKGRWFEGVAGGAYEVRARWWSAITGTFLNIDEYNYHDPGTSLWGWPEQNPVRRGDTLGRGLLPDTPACNKCLDDARKVHDKCVKECGNSSVSPTTCDFSPGPTTTDPCDCDAKERSDIVRCLGGACHP
jgi:RHS repeat-associated protein